MLVELHVLQNFAPSNLNRDDTGAPKDCELGGHRRARISSQAIKRAMRDMFKEELRFAPGSLAIRTKRLVDDMLVPSLMARGREDEVARSVVERVLASVKITYGSGEDEKRQHLTEYLLFLGQTEIDRLVDLCDREWDGLTGEPQPAEETTPTRTRRAAKKSGGEAVPATIATAVKALLDGGKAADLALFGRMIADLPERNVDAASQVAHAISTNRVNMEMDFFTAVDDIPKHDNAGAGMLGTVGFNSACFYRYSNVDLAQLRNNLGADDDLARKTLEAFLWSSILAIPSGKQNSMAAHNPPSLILAVARESGPWNLANAFVKPCARTVTEAAKTATLY